MRMQVIVVAVFVGLGVVSWAPAYYAGGAKKAKNDCLIGYNGIDQSDVTQPGTKKQRVECTDCDPSCDFDGDSTANGSCTFKIGVCLNQETSDCVRPNGLDKATAKYKVKKVKGKDVVKGEILLEDAAKLMSSACGAFVPLTDLVVDLKPKKDGTFTKNSGSFKLSGLVKKNKQAGQSKRKDKNKLSYVCLPRPAGQLCPSTTTTTIPSFCGNAIIEGSEECDDGNANDGDGCTKLCLFCGSNGGGGSVTPPLECQVPLTCKTGPNNGNACSSDDDCEGGFCTTSNIPGCDANCTLPACGNSNVSGSETCDDGNTSDFDNCPSDCIIDTCTNPGGTYSVSVNFAGSEDVSGIEVFVDYPEGEVIIPGSGEDATAAISDLPGSASATGNDYDHVVQVAVADFAAFPSGLLFNLAFESCDGAMPSASEFTCTVISAGGVDLQPIPGVTCSVSVP